MKKVVEVLVTVTTLFAAGTTYSPLNSQQTLQVIQKEHLGFAKHHFILMSQVISGNH